MYRAENSTFRYYFMLKLCALEVASVYSCHLTIAHPKTGATVCTCCEGKRGLCCSRKNKMTCTIARTSSWWFIVVGAHIHRPHQNTLLVSFFFLLCICSNCERTSFDSWQASRKYCSRRGVLQEALELLSKTPKNKKFVQSHPPSLKLCSNCFNPIPSLGRKFNQGFQSMWIKVLLRQRARAVVCVCVWLKIKRNNGEVRHRKGSGSPATRVRSKD